MQRRIALICLPFALALTACSRVAGHGDYVIRGSLIDAETAAPVTHPGLLVHCFHDASNQVVSLGSEVPEAFEIHVPNPTIRLRIIDKTNQYELHEEQLEVPKDGLDHVVRLVPTHFVLLKVRILVNEGGAWVLRAPHEVFAGPDGRPIFWGTPHMYFEVEPGPEGAVDGATEHGPDSEWSSDACYDSTFELRVPRKRLRMSTINSELVPNDPILDLSGVTGDVVEREIRFVKYR